VITARVNLLPPEIGRRSQQRRLLAVTAGALAVYVALLGLLYTAKLGRVEAARQERDTAQAEVTRLQGEVLALAEFRDLALRLEERERVLTAAMGAEVSVARILNDLSLAFPGTASMRSLNLALASTSTPAADGAAPAPSPSDSRTVGSLTFEGYSVERYAPGVESLLLNVEQVSSFQSPYVAAAQEEQIGSTEVTGFSGTVDIDEDAYTRRYAAGLPEEGRQ
jgi:hypothetical protein